MATVRRAGFGSVFEVENETVGIGTTGTATNTVQVLGETKASNALVVGLSTLTTYQGFVDSNAEFGNSNVDINSQSGTMGNIEICHGDFNVSSASTLTSSVNQLTLTDSFSVPTGNTDSRIHCQTAGSMRFNEDLGTLEFYTGDEWRTVNSFKDTVNRGRGVFGGGWNNPTNTAHMHYIQIATLGNSRAFGDLTQKRRNPGGRVSNETRGIISGGYDDPAAVDIQDYCTIASEGDFADFGNLTAAKYAIANGGVSSSTRGVTGGGSPVPAWLDVLEYVQISTIGNALDFGDLTQGKGNTQAVNSATRGLFCGGQVPTLTNVGIAEIDSISIASLGNAIDFGDMRTIRYYGAGVSNGVRGVIAGGVIANPGMPGYDSSIEFVTIASDGNSIPFGELTTKRSRIGSTETLVRGVFIGSVPDGPTASAYTNVMDFINIASAGNAQDFGDMTNVDNFQVAGFSDSHGGLGGF